MMIDRTTILRFGALSATAVVLSACGGGGNNASVTTPVVIPSFASQFGTGFGTDFAAAANSTPASIMSSDIIPVSLTASPTPFPS